MSDEPTPGELSRRFDEMSRRLDRLTELIAKLPSTDLVATQQGRIVDRVTLVERDVAACRADMDRGAASLQGSIIALQHALDGERDARLNAVAAESRARELHIESEKTRIGVWFRWLTGGVMASVGAAVATAVLTARPG